MSTIPKQTMVRLRNKLNIYLFIILFPSVSFSFKGVHTDTIVQTGLSYYEETSYLDSLLVQPNTVYKSKILTAE